MHFTIWSGSTRPKFYVFRTNHDQSYLPPRLTWYKIRLAKSHRKIYRTFRCLSLDLPFHGENKAVAVEDFESNGSISWKPNTKPHKRWTLYPYRLLTWWANCTILCIAGSSAKRQFTSSDFRRGEFRFIVWARKTKPSSQWQHVGWAFFHESLKPCLKIGINSLCFLI